MMIKFYFKYIFGFIIIFFIFWNRFIRDRTQGSIIKNVDYIFFDYLKYFIIIILIIYFLISFIINIKNIFNLEKNNYIINIINNTMFIKKMKIIFYDYIVDAPNFIYVNITKKINLKPILEQPASYFVTYFYYTKTFVLLFIAIPRIVTATFFVISVLYLKTMFYFYYSLNLLIPLLLYKIFIYICYQFSSRYLDTIESLIKFEPVPKTKGGGFILKIIPQNEYFDNSFSYDHYLKQFPTFCTLWHIYVVIYNSISDFKQEENLWSPYIIVYTSSCFIVGWSFILYNIIF